MAFVAIFACRMRNTGKNMLKGLYVKDGVLVFPTKLDYQKTNEFVKQLTWDEYKEWEKENNFISFEDVFYKALNETYTMYEGNRQFTVDGLIDNSSYKNFFTEKYFNIRIANDGECYITQNLFTNINPKLLNNFGVVSIEGNIEIYSPCFIYKTKDTKYLKYNTISSKQMKDFEGETIGIIPVLSNKKRYDVIQESNLASWERTWTICGDVCQRHQRQICLEMQKIVNKSAKTEYIYYVIKTVGEYFPSNGIKWEPDPHYYFDIQSGSVNYHSMQRNNRTNNWTGIYGGTNYFDGSYAPNNTYYIMYPCYNIGDDNGTFFDKGRLIITSPVRVRGLEQCSNTEFDISHNAFDSFLNMTSEY